MNFQLTAVEVLHRTGVSVKFRIGSNPLIKLQIFGLHFPKNSVYPIYSESFGSLHKDSFNFFLRSSPVESTGAVRSSRKYATGRVYWFVKKPRVTPDLDSQRRL
jgi:hypothetical protein